MTEPLAKFEIGRKVENLRSKSGWSRGQLASRSELTEAEVREIEAGERVPSLESLARIADALSVTLETFFCLPSRGGAPRDVEVVRSSARWSVPAPTRAARALDFRYQALTNRQSGRAIAPFLIEIPPQKSVDLELSAHPGEEFLFVLAGELEARIGEETYHLQRGDSVYFDSRTDHALRAEGAQSVRVLACFAGVDRDYESDPLERAFQVHEEDSKRKER